MWTVSSIKKHNVIKEITPGQWIPARPMNDDFRPFLQRLKEAWQVFTGKASAFLWK